MHSVCQAKETLFHIGTYIYDTHHVVYLTLGKSRHRFIEGLLCTPLWLDGTPVLHTVVLKKQF